MFEQAFKNIDDVLRKEAGCTTELDYTEQTSWLLFLKYLDALEQDRADEAALDGKKYSYILEKEYRWESWAAPKTADGKLDHNKAMVGDDLRDFVNQKLFPYLHGFKQRASGPNTIEYKIGEIFGEIKNKIQSGYNLREIVEHIDELRFRSQQEKHELSHLYEAKIRNMGNAGRNGGEYYTPRPLIRAIVKVINPQIGEKIYDGACGSAGFLCESFDYLKASGNQTTKNLVTLQKKTFYGKEKKSLAYVIAIMNMILHGIEAPNVIHTNTLSENLADIQEKDRYDIVMANPPFGGKERKEVQQNFPIRTGETAFLFLQHFIKILKAGGRAGIVIKNTFLSNTDNASVKLREQLLESCNLHTVLDCPSGTFQGAGVKTVVLFFEKGAPTRKIWFYQLDPARNLGKTNPLNDDDLAEFVKLQNTFGDSLKSWSVGAKSIDQTNLDLSAKNPNGGEEIAHRSPGINYGRDCRAGCRVRGGAGKYKGAAMKRGWPKKTLGEVCGFVRGPFGGRLKKSVFVEDGFAVYEQQHAIHNQFEEIRYFIDDAKFREMRRFEIRPRDLIMSCSGTMGRVAIVPNSIRPGIINQALLKLTPSSAVSPEFLKDWMDSPDFQDSLKEQSGGAAIQNVASVEILKQIKIALPPLREQQRIVGILDEAYEGIATAKANALTNLHNARAIFESHLQSVFTQLGTGWVEKSLGDIAQVKGGKRVPKGYKLLSEPTEFPYLRVTDFNDLGSIDMSDLRYVSAEVHREITNYVIYSADMYLSIAGTIGKTGIIPEELDGANLTENACRLVFRSGISNRFAYYFTTTDDFEEQAGLNTRTAAQPKLALSRLSTIRLGVPSLAVQESLADKFDALREKTQRLESIYRQKLAALEALKKSLLHQVFTGQL